MADQASKSTDVADEATDAAATAESPEPGTKSAESTAEPILASDPGGDNLLGELARAMHAAATSQYERLNADLERRRAEQVEAIAARTSAEIETLKADSETDIGSIELWAKGEIEKIKLERLRRIDARREELAGQLERQDTIKEREIFAIEVAIDAHRNEVDVFFGRMERENDPSAIARVASSMPPFPTLADVAEQARLGAAAEFAAIDRQEGRMTAEAEATAAAIESAATTGAETATPEPVATAEPVANAATTEGDTSAIAVESDGTVSESRLMAVMDPAASRGETGPTPPWEAPYAVSVAAGTGQVDEPEPAPVGVGSTLLRTVRSIRPMAGRHDKDSGEGDASR